MIWPKISAGRLFVVLGTGGVGKTSLSAALGYYFASHGEKILVLTIDPSQRLKSTLNLSKDENWTRVLTPGISGELWGGLVQSETIFDDFIRKSARSPESAERMIHNRLYQELRSTLGGSQEFTSLEALLQASLSGKFDRIILDTPPAQNAFQFLEAPQKLSDIFSDKVSRWFRLPTGGKRGWIKKVFEYGTDQVTRILEVLTGSTFVKELADFFDRIQDSQSKLIERAGQSQKLLTDTNTFYIMVAGPGREKLEEARFNIERISQAGFNFKCLLVNRVAPEWVYSTQEKDSSQVSNYFQERLQQVKSVSKDLGFSAIPICEMDSDVQDLTGIRKLSEVLVASFAKDTKESHVPAQ